jgi:hypothetical protein
VLIRSLGLTLVLIGAFSLSAKAQSSFTIDLYQDGSNVVATGSGDIDTSDLTNETNLGGSSQIAPSDAFLVVDPSDDLGEIYTGISGPTSFGIGGDNSASSSSGDIVGIDGSGALDGGYVGLILPRPYTSGNPLSVSATWDDTTLSGLGVTPGTYTWTWGPDGENTFTLNAVAVPEPAQYGWGVLIAALGFVAWRRFSTRAARA